MKASRRHRLVAAPKLSEIAPFLRWVSDDLVSAHRIVGQSRNRTANGFPTQGSTMRQRGG
ncbi:MAG: hypothetical protein H7Y43_01060 [Akkermansiaceae bacterium]|nr:hypothetical protein [Verrucomicrobiales bacterium]